MKNQTELVALTAEVLGGIEGRLIEFRPRTSEFKVFLDEEVNETAVLLNKIRLSAPPEAVIMIVGLVRGKQIAADYARKYAPHLGVEVEEHLNKLLAEVCGKHLIS